MSVVLVVLASFLLATFGGEMMIINYNHPHRDTEEPEPGPHNQNPGRRSSWVNVVWKVWMSVRVSEDPPTPGDTL